MVVETPQLLQVCSYWMGIDDNIIVYIIIICWSEVDICTIATSIGYINRY